MKVKDIKKFERLHNIELPKDTISETGVIGTLLMHPEFIYISDFLKPNQFYNRELACIYHIIKTLMDNGIKEIDNFLIIAEIEGNNGFKNIINEYSNISNDLCSWLDDLKLVARPDVESYELISKKVVSNAFKRDSYIKLRELANGILDSTEDINAINYKLQTDVTKFADNYIVDTNVQTIGEKVDDIWNLILSRRNDSGFAGIPSKYKDLNQYFTYENGELVVIGGRAKSGKSMFFLNEAIHKVENGVPTAIFDTEMSDERWMIRFLALKSGVDIKKVKNGNYSLKEEQAVVEAKDWLKNKPLVHIYDTEWTKDKIYMTAKQLKQSINLSFLIYDYIKVDNTSGLDLKEHNVLGDMTNFLKNKVGGALDIPVMAGGQMSPKEQRLADSDKINRYASTIAYWMHKTKEEMINDGTDAGNCKLFIDYNRNGMQMEEDEYLNFVFDGNKATIDQAKKFYNIEGGNLPY
jgi:replicative DNA helicase